MTSCTLTNLTSLCTQLSRSKTNYHDFGKGKQKAKTAIKNPLKTIKSCKSMFSIEIIRLILVVMSS